MVYTVNVRFIILFETCLLLDTSIFNFSGAPWSNGSRIENGSTTNTGRKTANWCSIIAADNNEGSGYSTSIAIQEE